jgi:hypothetical protein
MPIVKRSDKSVKLTKEELDGNFVYLLAQLAKTPILISQSYAPVTRSSNNSTDATYTTLATVTVPGGLMNLNGKVVIEQDWKFTSSASSKTLRVDWGGNWITGPSVTTTQNAYYMLAVKNANSLSSQIMLNGTTFNISPLDTFTTVDTTQDVAIEFKCNWNANVASEQIILRGHSVWYYPGNT